MAEKTNLKLKLHFYRHYILAFVLITVLLLCILVSVLAEDGTANSSGLLPNNSRDILKRREVLKDGVLEVDWIVDFDTEEIEFLVTARTKGYVGLGISYTGSMQHSDIVIGGVYGNGSTYFSDWHGNKASTNTFPLIDVKQDWYLLKAAENETHTILKFNRKLDTCDDEDIAITNDTLKLIWSYGTEDEITYHGSINRGALSVNFRDPASEATNLSEYAIWRLAQDLEIPSEDTTYWCTYFKGPQLSKKHHIVGFDIFLNGTNSKQHTHHADLYKCTPPNGENIDEYFAKYLGYGYDCYFSKEYHPVEHCQLFESQWSKGGKVTMFPENAGIPFGEDENEYYMTEIHYDNPTKLAGIKLQSGMEMYYTDKLREIDAGFLQVGVMTAKTYSLTIPPNSHDFVVSSHCPSECTSNLPEEGVNAFVYLLHSHLSGRKEKIRHFRGDEELPYIANDEHYDFNYQNNRHFKTELKLLPGDHLTLECTYDSNWKKGLSTLGGRSARDEMCQTFIMYYPRVLKVNQCGSYVAQEKMLDYFGIGNVTNERGIIDPTILEPENLQGTLFSKHIESINWTPEKRAEYQQMTRYGKHDAYCIPYKDSDNFMEVQYPKVKKEYKVTDTCSHKDA